MARHARVQREEMLDGTRYHALGRPRRGGGSFLLLVPLLRSSSCVLQLPNRPPAVRLLRCGGLDLPRPARRGGGAHLRSLPAERPPHAGWAEDECWTLDAPS